MIYIVEQAKQFAQQIAEDVDLENSRQEEKNWKEKATCGKQVLKKEKKNRLIQHKMIEAKLQSRELPVPMEKKF